MPQFRYVAVASTAETIEGRMEAASKAAVVDRLHALGHVPIRIDELGGSPLARLLTAEVFAARRVPPRALALLTGQLATLLKAGVALDEALAIMVDLADKDAEKAALRGVLDRLSSGVGLADAMAAQRDVFPDFYVSMVRAGEAGASLEAVLERLAEFLERREATREHVKSALLYPAIVAATCGLSLALLFVVVVPRLRPLFEQHPGELPISAAWLLAASDFVETGWWACLLVLVAAAATFRRRLRNPAVRARWDRRVLAMPLVGELAAKIEVGRFSRTLGTLLKNGVPLLAALAITRETVRNRVFADAMTTIIERAKTGKGLAEPLRHAKVFPPLAVHLVRIGEESGRQDDILLKLADVCEADARRKIDRLLALMGPAVTIALGIVVAAVILSIMSALLGVYELTM